MAAVEKFASNSAMNTSVVPVILKPSKPAQLHVKVASIFEESSDSEKEIEYQKRKNNLTLEILANELKRDRRHSREEEDLDPMPISYFPKYIHGLTKYTHCHFFTFVFMITKLPIHSYPIISNIVFNYKFIKCF